MAHTTTPARMALRWAPEPSAGGQGDSIPPRKRPYRVLGPRRSLDGRAVWLVVRPLGLAAMPHAVHIECECLSNEAAERVAAELNCRAGLTATPGEDAR